MLFLQNNSYSWHPALSVLRGCGLDPSKFDDLVTRCIELGDTPDEVFVVKGMSGSADYFIVSSPLQAEAFFSGYKYGKLKATLIESASSAASIMSKVMSEWPKVSAVHKSDFIFELKVWLKTLGNASTDSQVGKLIGYSRPVVTNLLRLQRLNPQVRSMVSLNTISLAKARTLVSLPHKEQLRLARMCIDRDLSYRDLYKLVFPHRGSKREKLCNAGIDKSPDIKRFERTISERSGLDISYSPMDDSNKNGSLDIKFETIGEVQRILDLVISASKFESQAGKLSLKIERMEQIDILFRKLITEGLD